MEALWAIVQGIGAIVGLMSGVYLLIEIWTKEHPTAIVVAAPLGGIGQRSSYLRVTNRSTRPMLIRLPNRPNGFGALRAAVDHSISAIVSASVFGETWFALDPSEAIDLPLLKPADYEDLDEESEMAMVIDWRFAQPILWRGTRHLRVSISKASYKRLLKGKSTRDDSDEF